MALRVLWGLCVALSAMLTGVGIELALTGAGPVASYPLVVAGFLLLPAGSAVLDRLVPAPAD